MEKDNPVEYIFAQLVDLMQVRQLLEAHHRLSGMAYGLFDTEENNLVAVGWQDICVRFHRTQPLSCLRCRESDVVCAAGRATRSSRPISATLRGTSWSIGARTG